MATYLELRARLPLLLAVVSILMLLSLLPMVSSKAAFKSSTTKQPNHKGYLKGVGGQKFLANLRKIDSLVDRETMIELEEELYDEMQNHRIELKFKHHHKRPSMVKKTFLHWEFMLCAKELIWNFLTFQKLTDLHRCCKLINCDKKSNQTPEQVPEPEPTPPEPVEPEPEAVPVPTPPMTTTRKPKSIKPISKSTTLKPSKSTTATPTNSTTSKLANPTTTKLNTSTTMKPNNSTTLKPTTNSTTTGLPSNSTSLPSTMKVVKLTSSTTSRPLASTSSTSLPAYEGSNEAKLQDMEYEDGFDDFGY